jgi:hypothetical protein
MGTYIDDTFSWDDIKWLRSSTKLPMVAKGVQTAEDAVLAMKHGLDGIVITNHGGRNLDTYENPCALPSLYFASKRIDTNTGLHPPFSHFSRSGAITPKFSNISRSISTAVFGVVQISSKPCV